MMGEMMREVAENVSESRVPQTGHSIAEENPDATARLVREFFLESLGEA